MSLVPLLIFVKAPPFRDSSQDHFAFSISFWRNKEYASNSNVNAGVGVGSFVGIGVDVAVGVGIGVIVGVGVNAGV
jgi:hypothetical protein